MNKWKTMNKWVITDAETDEPILIYKGTFFEVSGFLNQYYEDGKVDVETYDNWLNRQIQKRTPEQRARDSFEESIANGWIYG